MGSGHLALNLAQHLFREGLARCVHLLLERRQEEVRLNALGHALFDLLSGVGFGNPKACVILWGQGPSGPKPQG